VTGGVFVDTGAWIALLRKDDAKHMDAARGWARLLRDGARLITSSFVVSESATRLRYDAGLPAALAFRDRIRQAVDRGLLRVVWIDEEVADEGWGVLERYADLALSLTDATSAAIATRLRITDVFTFDADFRPMGFTLHPG
jgi:predicted nucleic acid-binding protein